MDFHPETLRRISVAATNSFLCSTGEISYSLLSVFTSSTIYFLKWEGRARMLSLQSPSNIEKLNITYVVLSKAMVSTNQ